MSFLPIVAVGLQVASVVAQSSAMKAQGEAQNQDQTEYHSHDTASLERAKRLGRVAVHLSMGRCCHRIAAKGWNAKGPAQGRTIGLGQNWKVEGSSKCCRRAAFTSQG